MDFSTATPRAFDEHLANLYGEQGKCYHQLRSARNAMHYLLGERPTKNRSGVILGWPTTDSEAEAAVRTLDLPAYNRDQRDRAIERARTASDAIDSLSADIVELEAMFDRRGGWARFFTVPGGHIHSGQMCAGGTIRPSTDVRWNPALSGKTEADAVASQGPLLCTHCFPSAPVEWTRGVEDAKKKTRCAGSGNRPKADARVWRSSSSHYAVCAECKTGQRLTGYGLIRAHQPPKS